MDSMVQGQLKEWFVMLVAWGFFGACVYVIAVTLRRLQQNSMQKHLLEKFSSAQDFAAFVQSPAGQKYVMSFSEAVTSPRNTILSSVRTGVVLVFAGGGLAGTISGIHNSYIWGLGLVLMCVGFGFLVSAVISYWLAKKIGREATE
jgi:hypothetical protein